MEADSVGKQFVESFDETGKKYYVVGKDQKYYFKAFDDKEDAAASMKEMLANLDKYVNAKDKAEAAKKAAPAADAKKEDKKEL